MRHNHCLQSKGTESESRCAYVDIPANCRREHKSLMCPNIAELTRASNHTASTYNVTDKSLTCYKITKSEHRNWSTPASHMLTLKNGSIIMIVSDDRPLIIAATTTRCSPPMELIEYIGNDIKVMKPEQFGMDLRCEPEDSAEMLVLAAPINVVEFDPVMSPSHISEIFVERVHDPDWSKRVLSDWSSSLHKARALLNESSRLLAKSRELLKKP